MTERREYRRYDPESVWRAVIDADGNLSVAAQALGFGEHTAAGYIMVKMSAAASRLGIMLPRGRATTREDRVAMAHALLGQGNVVLSAQHAPQGAMKVVSAPEPKRPEMPATCHPDREEFQLRLCRSCYDERMRRSQAATARGEVDRAVPAWERPPVPQKPHGRSGAIVRSHGGPRVFDSNVVRDQLEGFEGRAHFGFPLSAKEKEVMKHVALGETNKVLAYQLGISEQTVKNHMSAILRKLGATTRTEAVLKMGWVNTDGFDALAMLQGARAALAAIGETYRAAEDHVRSLELLVKGGGLDALGPGDTIKEAG